MGHKGDDGQRNRGTQQKDGHQFPEFDGDFRLEQQRAYFRHVNQLGQGETGNHKASELAFNIGR